MLVGAMELLKAEPSPEHNQMLLNELMKAELLIPVVLTPMPEPDAEGNIKPAGQTKMQFPVLSAPDGKNFFAVYTDKPEYEKRGNFENQVMAVVKFEEVMMMTLHKDSISSGAVLNPFSANLVIGKEMMAGLMGAKLAQLQKSRQQAAKPDAQAGMKPEK